MLGKWICCGNDGDTLATGGLQSLLSHRVPLLFCTVFCVLGSLWLGFYQSCPFVHGSWEEAPRWERTAEGRGQQIDALAGTQLAGRWRPQLLVASLTWCFQPQAYYFFLSFLFQPLPFPPTIPSLPLPSFPSSPPLPSPSFTGCIGSSRFFPKPGVLPYTLPSRSCTSPITLLRELSVSALALANKRQETYIAFACPTWKFQQVPWINQSD